MEQQYVGDFDATRVDVDEWSSRWGASGAAGLSGRPDGLPLAVPLALVHGVASTAAGIAAHSAARGHPVAIDGLALLGERAALTGMSRDGSTSCGGATRLLATFDGTIALSLARPDDIGSMAAWLETTMLPTDLEQLWPVVARLVADRSSRELVSRATLLGLPCSEVGEAAATDRPLVEWTRIATVSRSRREVPIVVDLSSLWAGPLCAELLGRAGCRIVKVESIQRPDGARDGSTDFYDLLHGGHESVALDFEADADRAALRALLASADVVIEASRPRALVGLGLDRSTIDGPDVWVSITGHGREAGAADRVAFGDDAAAAGGLVTADDDGLCFCCDAVADPLTGMAAAAATLEALAAEGRWTIDLALSRVAAAFAGGPLVEIAPAMVVSPRARRILATAAPLGEHTDQILAEFGIRR